MGGVGELGEVSIRCRSTRTHDGFIGLDLIVVLSHSTVSTSTVTAHTASGGDEPLREDVSVILTVSVDEEEHKGEAELGGAVRQLDPRTDWRDDLTRQGHRRR